MSMNLTHRYYNDAKFHNVVNMLEQMLHDETITEEDLLEAARYAIRLHEHWERNK